MLVPVQQCQPIDEDRTESKALGSAQSFRGTGPWIPKMPLKCSLKPGGYESQACCITDRGVVAGFASSGTADPFSLFGTPTQWRSFIWQGGVMHDIGTLGGPDAVMTTMNGSDQMSGHSYASDTPNPSTGIPTMDSFLWQNGHMQDLGSLGGTIGFANWMNNRGDVAGTSDLAGDRTHHGFLWSGSRLVNLGTLGGDNSEANWVNDAGDVVGRADLPGSNSHDAFLWKNGSMTDLGTLPGQSCSTAYSANNSDQVVGNAGICGVSGGPPFLWQKGTLYDLQALVGPTALRLNEVLYINEQGEIAGLGVLPDGNQHMFLLVPAALAAREGLTPDASALATPERSNVPRFRKPSRVEVGPAPRALRLHGYHRRTA